MTRQLPWPLAWAGRGLLSLAALAVVIATAVWLVVRFATAERASCSTRVDACLDPRTGLLRRERIDGPDGDADPMVPCRFVGAWLSRRDGTAYRVTLSAGGSYVIGPSVDGGGSAQVSSGYWAVQGGSMIWRHDQRRTGPDINPILDEAPGRFELLERDGSRTEFRQLLPAEASACAR